MLDVDDSLCGQVIDLRYGIEYCIGRGGMGVVWRARHIQTRQLFALKTLRPHVTHSRSMLRRLLHEARATAAVQSRNVVRVVDVKPDYLHQGVELPFIVMELLEGQSFSDFLETRKHIEPAELVWVMQQVSRGLLLAHHRGIIHRDLKPSNVFLARDEDGEVVVKLCDFGIAKLQGTALVDLAETGTMSTETGVVFGTPRYMAPEQLRRAGREGPETDQWAFALVVFRALSGHSYFESARNVAELILAIVHEPMPAPSSLSPRLPVALDNWFLRSCSRDSERRFADVQSQQMELEQALGSPTPLPIELPPQPSSRPSHPEVGFVDSDVQLVPARRSRPSLRLLSPFYWALVTALAFALVSTGWLRSYLRTKPSVMPLEHAPPAVSPSSPNASSGSTSSENSIQAMEAPLLSVHPTAATARVSPALLDTQSSKSRSRSGANGAQSPHRAAPPALLPRGSVCTRSAQCADGLCAAEVCQ